MDFKDNIDTEDLDIIDSLERDVGELEGHFKELEKKKKKERSKKKEKNNIPRPKIVPQISRPQEVLKLDSVIQNNPQKVMHTLKTVIIKLPNDEEIVKKFSTKFTLRNIANFVKKSGREKGKDKGKYKYIYEKGKYNFTFVVPNPLNPLTPFSFDLDINNVSLGELAGNRIFLEIKPKKEFIHEYKGKKKALGHSATSTSAKFL